MQGPEGRRLYGMVKIGEKGQIVIPKEARELFNLKPGDYIMVGSDKTGIALFPENGELFQKFYEIMGGKE